MPGHDRRKLAAVRSPALGDRSRDFFRRPSAEASILVRREIGAIEHAQVGNFESDL